jgi:uroporphyrinogen decarboxylase
MTRPAIAIDPDFSRFQDVLLLRRAWARPPQFDFHINKVHKAAVLGRPAETGADLVEFFTVAGYDYVQVSVYMPQPELVAAQSAEKAGGGADSFSSLACVIESREHFRSKRWSWLDLAEGDTRPIQNQFDLLMQVADALPDSMKIVLHGADVFTFLWQLIGFNNLCYAIYEDPDYIVEVMDSLAEAQYHAYRRAIELAGDRIGAIFFSDDIAHGAGPFMSPDFFRKRLFPTMRRYADMGKAIGAPFIYHSDGKLYPVMDDLVELGVRGIQPLEPKAMDPLAVKERWPGRVCLMGNIDLDLMARGTADEVEAHVRDKIDRLNVGGGYMPGVSNTVPDYVKLENYIRMIETINSYPLEPIEVPACVC